MQYTSCYIIGTMHLYSCIKWRRVVQSTDIDFPEISTVLGIGFLVQETEAKPSRKD